MRAYLRKSSIISTQLPRRKATATGRGRKTGRSTSRRGEAWRRSETSRREARGETRRRSSSAWESWATDTSRRTLQSDTCTSSCRSANTRACCHRCGCGCARCTGTKSCAGVCGRRSVKGARDYVGAADDSQTEGALLFAFNGLLRAASCRAGGARGLRLALHSAELFGVGEDEVHVLNHVSDQA